MQLLCDRHDITLFMLVLGVLNIQLWNYTGQTDNAFGAAVANRGMPEFENTIGLFVNTIALRNTVNPTFDFNHFIEQIKENFLSDLCYSDVPFDMVVEQLNPDRRHNSSPFFQLMLNVQEHRPAIATGGLSLRHIAQQWTTSKFDISLNLEKSNGAIYGYVEYKTEVFSHGDIENIFKDLQALVTYLATREHANLFDLPCIHYGSEEGMIEHNDELEEFFQF